LCNCYKVNDDIIKFYLLNKNIYVPQTNLTKLNISSGQKASIYQKAPPGFASSAKQQTPNSNLANADTGATGSYIAKRDAKCINNVVPCTPANQVAVEVANGQIITSTHVGELQVPDGAAIEAFVIPAISNSLLSISQVVDVGFTVIYSKDKVAFMKDKQEVFSGLRDPVSRLWMVDLSLFTRPIAPAMPDVLAVPAATAAAAAPVLAMPAVRLQSKEEQVRYWHACFGFPAKASFVQALQDFLTVPGLSAADVKKHLSNSINTAYGHLDATRQNIKSTRLKGPPMPDASPPAIWIAEKEVTGRVHLDAAGVYPITGRDGSKYMLMFYSEDKTTSISF